VISLLEGIATTRAIRRYTTDPIPDDDLATIMFAASRAPSGSNRQPFRFLVLRDGPKAIEAKRLLGNAFRAGWAAKVASDGYEEGTGRDDSSPKARMARTMQHYVDHFEEIPVVVLACLVRYRDVHYTEGASIYPACQNLLLAARALGYGGALTGWHAFVEPELRDLLSIPHGVALSATITLGRPEGAHGAVRRRPIRELVYDDTWGGDAAWAVDPPEARFTSAGPPRKPADPVA
jgi:nitroreductase